MDIAGSSLIPLPPKPVTRTESQDAQSRRVARDSENERKEAERVEQSRPEQHKPDAPPRRGSRIDIRA